eukprot:TRINITY_DN22221_c0_g1_i1.p2 TRINITY_DN22221_c0_g1~~TRINITY_DN22221_c0_g1_i1.p2  ORF type:complete len:111 (+),score=4.72 TRINITY_DN22221_c0_g1_i1:182-514(+)
MKHVLETTVHPVTGGGAEVLGEPSLCPVRVHVAAHGTDLVVVVEGTNLQWHPFEDEPPPPRRSSLLPPSSWHRYTWQTAGVARRDTQQGVPQCCRVSPRAGHLEHTQLVV